MIFLFILIDSFLYTTYVNYNFGILLHNIYTARDSQNT